LSRPHRHLGGGTISSFRQFLFGGRAFAVGFGSLATRVSVTSYFTRLPPRTRISA